MKIDNNGFSRLQDQVVLETFLCPEPLDLVTSKSAEATHLLLQKYQNIQFLNICHTKESQDSAT
jgi:hypothetical protein